MKPVVANGWVGDIVTNGDVVVKLEAWWLSWRCGLVGDEIANGDVVVKLETWWLNWRRGG